MESRPGDRGPGFTSVHFSFRAHEYAHELTTSLPDSGWNDLVYNDQETVLTLHCVVALANRSREREIELPLSGIVVYCRK